MNIDKRTSVFKKRPVIPVLVVLAIILVVYLPSLDKYLMSDDFEWLNQSYGAWENPVLFFKLINNFFRPLGKVLFLLEYTIFGQQVPFYNLITLLIHLLNVYLLYRFIHRVTGKIHTALFVALGFGISVQYSEAVLWVSARPDLLLLTFMLFLVMKFQGTDPAGKTGLRDHIIIILLTLGAIMSKETWIITPFVILAFLYLVKQIPFDKAISYTNSLFALLIIYLGYFFGLPLLTGSTAPSSYGAFKLGPAVKKSGSLMYRFLGFDEYFTGAVWQYIILVVLLGLLIYRLIRTRNHLALWGLVWLFLGVGIFLPVLYEPSRYNYIPMVGFWITAIAFLEYEIRRLAERFRLKPLWIIPVTVLLAGVYVYQQAAMLQLEIDDYRNFGHPHKVLVDMYDRVDERIPRDKPFIFIDIGKRKIINEAVRNVKGYQKVLFVRGPAIWQILHFQSLANFAGTPFTERMENIPPEDYDALFQGELTILVFSDAGFRFTNEPEPHLRDFYNRYRKLPRKVQALRFRGLN